MRINLVLALAFFNMMVPYPGTEMFDAHYGTEESRKNVKWEDWVAVGPRSAVTVPGVPTLLIARSVTGPNGVCTVVVSLSLLFPGVGSLVG